MRVAAYVLLASGVALAGSGGAPAIYVVGNLEVVSPGAEGILVLEKEQAVFRSGKFVLPIPYSGIHSLELGTKVVPPSVSLYKVWQLHKRFLTERPTPTDGQLRVLRAGRQGSKHDLRAEESAANNALAEIETRQGKRIAPKRTTVADSWWGDSAWKTTRNDNTVSPDDAGKLVCQMAEQRI